MSQKLDKKQAEETPEEMAETGGAGSSVFDVLGSQGVAALQVVSALQIVSEDGGVWLSGLGMLGNAVAMEVFSKADMATLPYEGIDVVYALWKIFREPSTSPDDKRRQYSRPSLLKEVAHILRESSEPLDFSEGSAAPMVERVISPPVPPLQSVVEITTETGEVKRLVFAPPTPRRKGDAR